MYVTRAFNGGVTYAELMASRRLFGIAEGILARDELLAQAKQEQAASAAWFAEAQGNEGVSV